MPHPLIRWFESSHLPPHLADRVRPIKALARIFDAELPDSAEKTAGLRKLLEAKDCFVRAEIVQHEERKLEENREMNDLAHDQNTASSFAEGLEDCE